MHILVYIFVCMLVNIYWYLNIYICEGVERRGGEGVERKWREGGEGGGGGTGGERDSERGGVSINTR
jgi:hypothetical protein